MTLLVALLAALLVQGVAIAGGAADSPDSALAALRAAVAAHPDDPDRSWSLALALEAEATPDEAAEQMRRHLARWPDRPSQGYTALGRCEFRAGRPEAARRALEQAIARDPRDAEAQLYLGLALQAEGEQEWAEQHFELAAALDRELAGEALLLSGMSRLSRGDSDGGHARLAQVIERAPESASARDARALLGDAPATRGASSFRAEAWTGALYDSNVTLGGEGDLPGAGPTQDDALFDYGTNLSWRPTLGEGRPIELSARYERMDYLELSEYSAQRVLGSAAGQLPLGPRAALRLDASLGYALLDDDPYLLDGALRPSLLVALGPHSGLLRLHAGGERLEYEDDPLFDSLELSGWAYGGGGEHLVPLGREGSGWLGWGGSYQRRDTKASRDELGFRSAYDGDRWRASLRSALSLPFQIRARAELAFDAELYDHRNLVDALTENPGAPDRRQDFVWSSAVSLRRKLVGNVEIELHAGFTDRDSNVDLFAYQRAMTGLRLHAAIP
jgi:tetratricopeptide (TPR) repeat protein/transposase